MILEGLTQLRKGSSKGQGTVKVVPEARIQSKQHVSSHPTIRDFRVENLQVGAKQAAF